MKTYGDVSIPSFDERCIGGDKVYESMSLEDAMQHAEEMHQQEVAKIVEEWSIPRAMMARKPRKAGGI